MSNVSKNRGKKPAKAGKENSVNKSDGVPKPASTDSELSEKPIDANGQTVSKEVPSSAGNNHPKSYGKIISENPVISLILIPLIITIIGGLFQIMYQDYLNKQNETSTQAVSFQLTFIAAQETKNAETVVEMEPSQILETVTTEPAPTTTIVVNTITPSILGTSPESPIAPSAEPPSTQTTEPSPQAVIITATSASISGLSLVTRLDFLNFLKAELDTFGGYLETNFEQRLFDGTNQTFTSWLQTVNPEAMAENLERGLQYDGNNALIGISFVEARRYCLELSGRLPGLNDLIEISQLSGFEKPSNMEWVEPAQVARYDGNNPVISSSPISDNVSFRCISSEP